MHRGTPSGPSVRITATGPLRDGETLFQRIMAARHRAAHACPGPAAQLNRAGGLILLGTGAALACIVALGGPSL